MTDRMTWNGARDLDQRSNPRGSTAVEIVAWGNGLGGQFRYEPDTFAKCTGRCYGIDHHACIVITGPDGDLIVHPGDTVIDTGKRFHVDEPSHKLLDWQCRTLRLFWVAAAGTGSDQ